MMMSVMSQEVFVMCHDPEREREKELVMKGVFHRSISLIVLHELGLTDSAGTRSAAL